MQFWTVSPQRHSSCWHSHNKCVKKVKRELERVQTQLTFSPPLTRAAGALNDWQRKSRNCPVQPFRILRISQTICLFIWLGQWDAALETAPRAVLGELLSDVIYIAVVPLFNTQYLSLFWADFRITSVQGGGDWLLIGEWRQLRGISFPANHGVTTPCLPREPSPSFWICPWLTENFIPLRLPAKNSGLFRPVVSNWSSKGQVCSCSVGMKTYSHSGPLLDQFETIGLGPIVFSWQSHIILGKQLRLFWNPLKLKHPNTYRSTFPFDYTWKRHLFIGLSSK